MSSHFKLLLEHESFLHDGLKFLICLKIELPLYGTLTRFSCRDTCAVMNNPTRQPLPKRGIQVQHAALGLGFDCKLSCVFF